MTPKDAISKTLLQLHANVITVTEAEKIIFPILDDIRHEGYLAGEKAERDGGGDDNFSMTANYYHQD